MPSETRRKIRGYGPGHPWYYVLGGPVLFPKEILAGVIASGYRGYMAHDIDKADAKSEPQRSQQLRRIRQQVRADLRDDLSRYREVARDLSRLRKQSQPDSSAPQCDAIHTAASLKHNHIYNGLAHLALLDALLSHQPDLFDL